MKTIPVDLKHLDAMAEEAEQARTDISFGALANIAGLIATEIMLADYHTKSFAPQYFGGKYSLTEIKELLENDYKPKFTEYFKRCLKMTVKIQDDPDDINPKKKLNDQHKKLIETIINTCRSAITLLDLASSIYDEGFKSETGKTAIVFSSLHFAASDSLNALSNFKLILAGKEQKDLDKEWEQLNTEYQYNKLSSFKRIIS